MVNMGEIMQELAPTSPVLSAKGSFSFTVESMAGVRSGIKTQTRRVANLTRLVVDLPRDVRSDLPEIVPVTTARRGRHRVRLGDAGVFAIPVNLGLKPGEFHFRNPKVAGKTHLANLGDGKNRWTIIPDGDAVLWTRETFAMDDEESITGSDGIVVAYRDGTAWRRYYDRRKDFQVPESETKYWRWKDFHWKSSMVMPKWASRESLRVSQVWLQRLWDITEEDAKAEGVRPDETGHRSAYARLWDEINGDRVPWSANPWVWTYVFTRVVP